MTICMHAQRYSALHACMHTQTYVQPIYAYIHTHRETCFTCMHTHTYTKRHTYITCMYAYIHSIPNIDPSKDSLTLMGGISPCCLRETWLIFDFSSHHILSCSEQMMWAFRMLQNNQFATTIWFETVLQGIVLSSWSSGRRFQVSLHRCGWY